MQMDLFSPSLRILQAPVAPAPALDAAPEPAPSSAHRAVAQAARDPASTTSTATGRARRIADAGERIEGARRDYYRQALCVAELSGMTGAQKTELVTKDAVWPTPDYAAWVEAGMPVRTAALVKVLRDSLPVRPRVLRERTFDEVAERYVMILGELREGCAIARSDEAVIVLAGALQDAYRQNGVAAVYKTSHSPLRLGGHDRAKAQRLIDAGFPGDREGWKRGYTLRRIGSEYVVCKQRRMISEPKPSEAAAWDWLRERLTAERALRKAESDRIPTYPHLERLERVGPEQPTGIDPDDFLTTFGFRGVQFGNWLPDGERQSVLDHAYAGLHDLCWLLGILPAHLALRGRRPSAQRACLGIAFGARGRGGRAVAHYEPGEVVLNMTKFTGAGRVAHEIWHGIDHWLALVGSPNEIERGEARYASGHNHHGVDRFAALPDLPRPLVEALTELLSACAKTSPSLEEAITRTERQLAQAERAMAAQREQIAQAERAMAAQREQIALAASAGRRAPKLIREAQANLDAWAVNFTLAEKRLALLRGGHLPADMIDSQASHYRRQAMILDPKARAYWSTPCELTARAFEAWCSDRLTAAGRVSQYLVHSVEEGFYAPPLWKADIYPAGTERRRINAAFDALIPLIAAEIRSRSEA